MGSENLQKLNPLISQCLSVPLTACNNSKTSEPICTTFFTWESCSVFQSFQHSVEAGSINRNSVLLLGAHPPWINFVTACPSNLLNAASSQQQNLVF